MEKYFCPLPGLGLSYRLARGRLDQFQTFGARGPFVCRVNFLLQLSTKIPTSATFSICTFSREAFL